jgi:hypothetical protein
MIPVPQKHLLDESTENFGSSMSESWLKGSTDSGYAFNYLSNSCNSFSQSMISMMDNPKMTNQSKGDVMRSGSAAVAAKGRMKDLGNTRNKSARTDESGSCYDSTQSEGQKNKTNANEAHGDGNTTTPFTRSSLASPRKMNVVSEYDFSKDYKGSVLSNHESVLWNYTSSMHSIDSTMLEDMMKRSYKTFDTRVVGSDINDVNISEDYRHVFDSGNSNSPSSASDNCSTSGRRGRVLKHSIMLDTSQGTNNNPFEDTDEGENDVHNISSNERSKSAPMDTSSSGDDGAQSIGLRTKTNGNDDHGNGSTTAPIKKVLSHHLTKRLYRCTLLKRMTRQNAILAMT